MKKVVINDQYGGFSLSDEAYEWKKILRYRRLETKAYLLYTTTRAKG